MKWRLEDELCPHSSLTGVYEQILDMRRSSLQSETRQFYCLQMFLNNTEKSHSYLTCSVINAECLNINQEEQVNEKIA